MPVIINASTSSGIGITADNSGVIQFQSNGSNTAIIDASGNVGIGTSSPSAKFNVYDATTCNFFVQGDSATSVVVQRSSTDPTGCSFAIRKSRGTVSSPTAVASGDSLGNYFFQAYGGTNTRNVASVSAFVDTYTSDSNISAYLTFNTSPSGSASATERMRIASTGEVFIAGTTDQGAYNLQVSGTGIWGAGAYVNGSDARIKDDIQPISSCLNIVQQLNPVTFRYKQDWSKDQSTQAGFVAQELKKVLANEVYLDGVVQEGPEYMSVAYQTLIPVLTKALQEAAAKIDALEARITELEAK